MQNHSLEFKSSKLLGRKRDYLLIGNISAELMLRHDHSMEEKNNIYKGEKTRKEH